MEQGLDSSEALGGSQGSGREDFGSSSESGSCEIKGRFTDVQDSL